MLCMFWTSLLPGDRGPTGAVAHVPITTMCACLTETAAFSNNVSCTHLINRFHWVILLFCSRLQPKSCENMRHGKNLQDKVKYFSVKLFPFPLYLLYSVLLFYCLLNFLEIRAAFRSVVLVLRN